MLVSSLNAYPVSPAWQLLLRDLSIPAGHVLRRAGLPDDLFAREHATLRADEYCRLMAAFEAEAGDPTLPLRVGEALSFEMFDPPCFAAMCSDDLNTALGRLGHYKRLCAPIGLGVVVGAGATTVTFTWAEPTVDPPPIIYALEVAYCMKLARLGTRRHVRARAVTSPQPMQPAAAYTDYFGVPVAAGPDTTISFAAADAAAPFLTANAGMWSFFEPELRRRLAELDVAATVAARVRAALLELLPSGRASVQAVAGRLGISARTLQRRLRDEATSFQRVLDGTREELARHYLGATVMSGAEISFLLGFEDPNSFVRAFHDWTGTTPEQLRAGMRQRRAG